MSIVNSSLELILTDKQTGEEWECNYDVSYIENLTRKTGNFKQFQIFTAMIRSGLLKTSDSIGLDLLTYEDLEALRIRRIRNHYSNRAINHCNRRYLIVTYSVEFDKINYPLPLEYCGYPDPIILQDTIRRLELELCKANEELQQRNNSSEKQTIKMLQNRQYNRMQPRVDVLTSENKRLHEEVNYLSKSLSKGPKSQVQTFHKAIAQIEKNLMSERNSHHKLLEKLQNEKTYLTNQLEKLKISERSLKNKLQQTLSRNPSAHNTKNYISKHLSASNACEPNIDTIFQRKKQSSKRNKCSHNHPSSRSVSPQIRSEDVWRRLSENIRLPSNGVKSRSRSSSMSSTRQSFGQYYLGLGSTEISPAPSGQQSRRHSPHSGQSSVQSFKSEIQRNKITNRMQSPTYSRSASPNLMQKVNKMFPKSRHMRKF